MDYNITKDSSGLDVIYMEGFSDRVETGDPMLPQKTFDVLLPPNVDRSSLQLKVVSDETMVLDGTYEIKPSPRWLPQQDNESATDATEVIKNLRTYQTNANYPEDSAQIKPTSQMRKWIFVPVNFIPFQYNPVTKKLVLHKRLTVEISFSLKEPVASQDAELLVDTVFDEVAQAKFINYEEASSPYLGAGRDTLGEVSGNGYAIVTTNDIMSKSQELVNFMEHKRDLRLNVILLTETQYGDGPDRADKIRNWLHENYIEKGIKYVLLIGNPAPAESGIEEEIPMKMCWPRLGADDGYQECPTDYFYADLTGNWDPDGDGYYGEYEDYTADSGVDLAADVYVGRIPVYPNDDSLDSILKKIMAYENPSADTGWRKSALLPMSFSDRKTDGAYLGEQMKNDYLGPYGYDLLRMYQHGPSGYCRLNSVFSSEENLRGNSVLPIWSNGDFGIVAWWGHGNNQGAYVGYGSCADGPIMLSSNTDYLDDDHPSHTYQCSCLNGYPEDSGNLQHAILKNGGISTTSATRVSWYYVGQTSFAASPSNAGMGYEYVKRLVQGKPAGDALYEMKSTGVSGPGGYPEVLMNFYDFCLYGDPSVSLGISIEANNPPQAPDVPLGPISGKIRKTYTYTTEAVDPEGDPVKYTFFWGDGTSSTTSQVSSGTPSSASHKWTKAGTYYITAIATDSKGAESDRSGQLEVVITALGKVEDEPRAEAASRVQQAKARALEAISES